MQDFYFAQILGTVFFKQNLPKFYSNFTWICSKKFAREWGRIPSSYGTD